MLLCRNEPPIVGVCLCVGSGESINICVHRSNVSAAFYSGGRPVFWAGGQAAVCTSTERVCVFKGCRTAGSAEEGT